MGAVAAKQPAPLFAEREDHWQRQATAEAVIACKQVIGANGINARSMISSLSDLEWGWIAAAAIFAWIKTKAQHAVEEGTGYDIPIRSMTYKAMAPWEAGAIETILPALGGLEGVDWSKPVGEWSKDQIVSFAYQINRLASSALAARDEGATDKLTRSNRDQMEREGSAQAGGPLMSLKELNDDIPF